MIDQGAATIALRNRLRTLQTTPVVTTGSASIAATATGYSGAAALFSSFYAGMEITPSGFTANAVDIVTAVASDGSTITTVNTHSAQGAGSGRAIAQKLPALRAWEMVGGEPVAGRHYLEEEFMPLTSNVYTMPTRTGNAREDGMYFVKWYAPVGYDVLAIRKCVGAVMALFTPGTVIAVGANRLTILGADPGSPGPQSSQILPAKNGLAVCSIRIPWRAESTNAVAA